MKIIVRNSSLAFQSAEVPEPTEVELTAKSATRLYTAKIDSEVLMANRFYLDPSSGFQMILGCANQSDWSDEVFKTDWLDGDIVYNNLPSAAKGYPYYRITVRKGNGSENLSPSDVSLYMVLV